jgi:perosamine synthetase
MTESRFVPVAAPVIDERDVRYVSDAVESTRVSGSGEYIDRFERGFADYCGVRNGIAVSNGTAALHLLLHGLGIGAGDEVVMPDLSFVATAHATLQAGAEPVFVDVEPDTFCLDPGAVERALSPRTRAIVAVHLYGHPADMDALWGLARPRGLPLLEDAAQAHGATLGGRRAGSMGLAGVFSFYGNKVITTGEGGFITTDDDQVAERLRFLEDHAMMPGRRYHHTEPAFNYRMTNLQAALGVAQLERIDEFIARKRDIAEWYREALAGTDGVSIGGARPGCGHVYWMTCALLSEGVAASVDTVCERLKKRGIDSRPFFVPMSQLPHLSRYRAVGARGDGCPVSASLSQRGFNLPSGAGLERADVARAAAALVESLSETGAGC